MWGCPAHGVAIPLATRNGEALFFATRNGEALFFLLNPEDLARKITPGDTFFC